MHVQRISTHGNPGKYGTWSDETKNKKIRDLAMTLHSNTLERRLLLQINRPPIAKASQAQGSRPGDPTKRSKTHEWEDEA